MMKHEYLFKSEPFKDERGIVLKIHYYSPPCCRGCPFGYYDWEHEKNVFDSTYVFADNEPITQLIVVDCLHHNICLRREKWEENG